MYSIPQMAFMGIYRYDLGGLRAGGARKAVEK
jgi:hypothetical protein